MRIEPVGSNNLSEVERFLTDHAETCMFLASNLANHGPTLGEHPSSGDFKCVRKGAELVGVFCLARRGNLLVELAGRSEGVPAVLENCRRGPVRVRGVLGEWAIASAIWDELVGSRAVVETYASRELLLNLELSEVHYRPETNARQLKAEDYEQWAQLNGDYFREEGLPINLSDDQRRRQFVDAASAGHWWGLWEGPRLLSIAALNARHGALGQVGGVFTPKYLRRRGHSRAVMRALLEACRSSLGVSKLILFTGAGNVAALGLYRALGFREIGEFALLFGEPQGVAPEGGA